MNPDVQNYLATYQHTQAYLRLSAVYCDYLGGIRWSSEDDALVYRDGTTFAFSALVADFLEGFSTGGRVIPFGCMLHWIHLLQNGRKHPDAEVGRLHRLFSATGSRWRNAGALAAALADGVPEPVQPPRLERVCRRLRDRSFPIRWFIARFHEALTGTAEAPAIAPADFERLVSERLAAFTDDELRDWLQHGRGPVREAGKKLASEQPPRSLTGVLAALLLRPRLAGAETYVTRLVGALTLPPRRLAPQELPVGGYADMTTHGEVEHILPSQHALDELEFLRRFAERELLFFRREEPPAQTRQELAVLIDQGVRTWGDVRLVLAAAALALGKQSANRALGFQLAGTSNGGRLLDPLAIDAETLGELVEASDLTFHPGAALETVLEARTEALRDIVLLTHPRNLREADVLAAARRAGPRDRLFAVALDEEGSATVSEIRRGAAVKLRQFHINCAPSRSTPPTTDPTEPLAALQPWTGDVERVPFPFRFGTRGSIKHFEFDHDGRHLLTVGTDGMLHLWSLDDDHYEVLPRPAHAGLVPTDVRRVVGVTAGFVLLDAPRDRATIAAHYDVRRRRVRVYPFTVGAKEVAVEAQYMPSLHTVRVLLKPAEPARNHSAFLDLRTGACLNETQAHAHPQIRSALADLIATEASAPPLARSSGVPGGLEYRLDGGTISVSGRRSGTVQYIPFMDGKPILQNARVSAAHAAADILAVLAHLADNTLRLLVFRTSPGALLREHRYDPRINEPRRFTVSPDGKWLAREWGPRIIVENIDTPAVQMTTRAGGFPGAVQPYLGKQCLLLSQGQGPTHWHLVDWSAGPVKFHYERKTRDGPLQHEAFRDAMQRPLAVVKAASAAAPPSYDRHRFIAVADHDHLRFMLDRFGQVAVFDRHNEALVCVFMAFRDQLAAWLPDGSRCGSSVLGLGPETPGARERLGKALTG